MNERIREMRELLHVTQITLATTIGVSNGNVGDWERGKSKPGADALASIVNSFGVSALWLLTGQGEILSKQNNPPEAQESVWSLSDYQKVAVEESLDCLTEEQAALINNYEKLDHRDKAEIRLLIEHKLKTYEMGLSSNSRTSKDGNSGSRTA